MSSGTARRRYSPRLPREERTTQILDATLRVLTREGPAALTVERVATEAAIAKSVLYAIFGSFEGLLEALVRREQERSFSVAADAVEHLTKGDVPSALRRFLDGVAEYPDTFRVVFMHTGGLPPAIRTAVEEGRERWRRELEPIAERFTGDAELGAHLIRGNVEYVARLVLDDPERFTRERILALAATLVQ